MTCVAARPKRFSTITSPWLLEKELPGAPYTYTNRLVADQFAFLEWTARAVHTQVLDGADSFVIENGWIVAQTIHYTVEPANRR